MYNFGQGHIITDFTDTWSRNDEYRPAVLLTCKDRVNYDEIGNSFAYFADNDDVFGEEFADHLIIRPVGVLDETNLPAAIDSIQTHFTTISHIDTQHPIKDGPYFVRGNQIHQAWRIYKDSLHAFVTSTIQDHVYNPDRY